MRAADEKAAELKDPGRPGPFAPHVLKQVCGLPHERIHIGEYREFDIV